MGILLPRRNPHPVLLRGTASRRRSRQCVGREEYAYRRGGVGPGLARHVSARPADRPRWPRARHRPRDPRWRPGLQARAEDRRRQAPAGRNALLRALGESRQHGPRVRQSRTTNRIPRGAGGAAEDRAAAVRDAVRAQLGEADRARCSRSWTSAACARWAGRSAWRLAWAWRITIRRSWSWTTAICWRLITTPQRKRTIPTRPS